MAILKLKNKTTGEWEEIQAISRWHITDAGTLGIDWSANISDESLYTNNATWHEFSTTYMID